MQRFPRLFESMMMMTCPTCGKKIPYDKGNPWRPFCCERCKMIDLGHWAAGDYQIQGAPGSADPEFIEQELERMRREALEKSKD